MQHPNGDNHATFEFLLALGSVSLRQCHNEAARTLLIEIQATFDPGCANLQLLIPNGKLCKYKMWL